VYADVYKDVKIYCIKQKDRVGKSDLHRHLHLRGGLHGASLLVFGGGSDCWGCTAVGIYCYYYQQGTEQRFVKSASGECGLSCSELLFRLDYALD
jgi:hypothetical protein